jgi:hypothetical protein
MVSLTVFVTKFDGTKQPYNRAKILKTSMRMGASKLVAESIADYVETRLYDGIETKKILQMIFRKLKKHKPSVKHQIDLRRALGLLQSAPDFELFVQMLLAEHGYEVTPNRIIRGVCVEHEVDGIVRKDGKTGILEVKHHFDHHTPTNLDVSRISRAVFEDVTEGYENGFNDLKIDYAMIVCNTKLTDHAKRYADCRGIKHIGWSAPKHGDLQTLIEEKRFYPVTYLRGLQADSRKRLTSAGIVSLKQLVEENPKQLRRKTGISRDKLESIISKAHEILSGN